LLHKADYTAEDYFYSFQQGEEGGFNYFFHLHYKPLLHFAYTFLNNTDAAEDVVEDSFLKLWQRRQTIEAPASIKPYLYATVRNRCIDVLRRQQHGAAYTAHIKKQPLQLAPDVTHNIIISESMHQVFLAVQNLPPKYQQLFNLLYVQGKEVKEIALELNLPLSTVKSQKGRTLELLRKQLPHLGILILLLTK
jgi:RNA polymerase sigma-70 factor (ECF subfamily)